MKFDSPRSFRQSVSWLHTWTGLPMGWLLFAVYLTGTLAYFCTEITFWMQPELHVAVASDNWLPKAVGLLAQEGKDAQQWAITPPGPRSPVVSLSYREAAPGNTRGMGGAGAEGVTERSENRRESTGIVPATDSRQTRSGTAENAQARPERAGEARQAQQPAPQQSRNQGIKRLVMDPFTGSVLKPRSTAGGNFLYRFHFELYGMDRIWGRWIVGVATLLMFIAIITGVIVHRNIFKDFFTFRPGKGKRSWLDGHNATGVLSLPFHILITFSGLLLLAMILMPWAADTAYNGDRRAYMMETRGMTNQVASSQSRAGQTANARETQALLVDLLPLYQQALKQWPDLGVGSIVVNNPGSSKATVEIRQAFGQQLTARGGAERLLFDGVSGEQLEAPMANPPTVTRSIWNVLIAVHEGRFATPVVRWLLFISGLLGSFMVASGLVMWLLSRQKEREALGRTPRGHRFVEVMNVGSVSGLILSIASYFWASRFISADLANRNEQEILCFFVVWGLSFVHALVRPHKRAWIEQLSAGAALFLLLPILNGLTGGVHLGQSLFDGRWLVAGFDLSALITGALLLFIAHRLCIYTPKSTRKMVVQGEAGASALSA